MGIWAITVPELATEFMVNGIVPEKSISYPAFQEAVLLGIVEREYRCQEIARVMNMPKKVILTDRGRMDGMAYFSSKNDFFDMARKYGYEPADLWNPYKAAIHLRSVACDRPELYTRENNAARGEKNVDEACARDKNTEHAWTAHPHLRVVGNVDESGKPIDIQQKTSRVIQHVASAIGVPVPLEIERKFWLKEMPKIPVHHEVIEITQYYLQTPIGSERIRIRTWRDSPVYYRTAKKEIAPGVREEVESIISEMEFLRLLKYVVPDSVPIQKTRYVFVWNDQYFELDVFSGRLAGLILLEIELTDINNACDLPIFIGKYLEVTGQKEFSNSYLARIKNKVPRWA